RPPDPSALELLTAHDVPSAQPLLARLADTVAVAPRPELRGPREPLEAPRLTAAGSAVPFALQHTAVKAKVSGTIARVEVTQLYQSPTADRLEAIYAFPLPANAAVTDMYFRIGRRIVYSEVQKKEQARRTYEAARDEGKT